MAFEVVYENKPALLTSKLADVWAFAIVIIEVRGLNVTIVCYTLC